MIGSVVKFIGHYGDEALSVARALTSILDGIALNPRDTAKVQATIDKLEEAANNIANAKPLTIKIDKKDIEAAVNEWMDKNAAAIIAGKAK